MKRRVTSVLLALCLVLTLLPMNVLPVFAAEDGGVTRLAGDNRFQTAFMAADQMKAEIGVSKFNTIIVASGTDFADALSGSYLATVKQAPILLVNRYFMDETAAYIDENLTEGGKVYLLGGENAISSEMEALLPGLNVERLAGDNRLGTNLEILEEAGVGDEEILVCYSRGFADSLSASAVGKPILMVNQGLTDAQKEFLATTSGKFIIIGGESAVSADLEAQLQNFGTIERIGGDNRYETSINVAKRFFANPETVVLAYGANFPDGLCGGALASAMDAPLILTMDNREAVAAGYVQENGIRNGVVMGGSALIADKTVENIFAALTPEEPTPEETEPEETEPEATEPEEPTPEWPTPEWPTPEETEPEATEPEATEPEEPTPEWPTPEWPAPEWPAPEETEPEETEPEATEPEATEPEATEPEATEPEATEPEVTEPEATEPEATEPEATEPEETTPEETTPEETTPEETPPEETVPEDTIPPDATVVDLTDKLNTLMRQNAEIMQQILDEQGLLEAAVYFYEKVKDGGDWDIKLQDEWKFEAGVTYVYRGRVMRMDDPGNIHFGYVGAVVFPEEVLCAGAGLNNISKFGFSTGDFESYFDDPQDQEMMRWGYQLYMDEH